MDALDAIGSRRSIGRLGEPAPSGADLDAIINAALEAPDHGSLSPWRFIILAGEAKDDFGDLLRSAYLARCVRDDLDPVESVAEKERTKLGRAPLVLVVCAVRRDDPKIPWEEQFAAAAAAAENALIAATALGYGSMWRTGDPAYDPAIKAALGIEESDAIVGFLYMGSSPPGGESAARATRQSRTESDQSVIVWKAPPAVSE